MNKQYTFADLAIILQDEFDINMGIVHIGDIPSKHNLTKEESHLKVYEIFLSLVDQFCPVIEVGNKDKVKS